MRRFRPICYVMVTEFLPGNQLTLLNSGGEYFPALLAAIAEAEEEIFLETYIFAADQAGHAVATALCLAARRGVRTHITVDGFGGRNFAADFLPMLRDAGVRVMVYRPEISRYHLRRHRLRRLHRKLVIIDGRVAFVGGINVVDDDNAPPDMRPRYDYAVRVEGPVLRDIHQAMRRMWESVLWANLKRRLRLQARPARAFPEAGPQLAAFRIRDNIRHRNAILNAYLDAISSARDEILIANAYFLPGIRFGRALYAARQRGVRISILLQGKSDHPLLRYATQALYSVALGIGIRIFEYEKSFLHAKVAVIDGHWATVGSSNIDPFSLLLAKEANLFIDDAPFAQDLRQSLEAAMAEGAHEMRAEDLAASPWHSRLMRWLAYGLVRALVGIAGYAQKHGDPRNFTQATEE